jgi:hypothetical protein
LQVKNKVTDLLQEFPQSPASDDRIVFDQTSLSFDVSSKIPCPITLEDKDNIVAQHKHSPRAPNSSPQRLHRSTNSSDTVDSLQIKSDEQIKIRKGTSQNSRFPRSLPDLFTETLTPTAVPNNTPLLASSLTKVTLPKQLEINSATSANQRWLRVSSFNNLESAVELTQDEKNRIFLQYIHSTSTPCNSRCESPMKIRN